MKYIIAALLMISTSAFAVDNVLTWDATPGADTIYVERMDAVCGTAGTWAEVATTPASNVTWTDTNVLQAWDKCYRIAASNVNGKSGYSNEAGKVPASPNGLGVI